MPSQSLILGDAAVSSCRDEGCASCLSARVEVPAEPLVRLERCRRRLESALK